MKHLNSYQKSNRGNREFEEYWNIVKNDDYKESYPSIANYLQNKIINSQSKRKRNTSMEKFVLSKKIKYALIIIILAVIGIACSMQVAQNDTLGYVMKWSVKKSNTDAADKINKLNWIDKNQLTVSANDIDLVNEDQKSQINGAKDEMLSYTVILQNTKEEIAKGYKHELENISGVTNIQFTPLTEKVKRSLFSTALNKIFKVEVDVSNMNDREVEKNLLEQFNNAGIRNIDLKISRDENGRRIMSMKLSKDSKEGGNYDIKVKDNDNVMRLKKVEKTDGGEDLQNKTDEEIRNQVRKDLDNPEINDDEIEITRDKGNVNVNVNVKKEK
jgi:hypothetical protein